MDGPFAAAMAAANVGVNKRSTDAVVFVDRSVVDRSASPLLMTLDGWAFFWKLLLSKLLSFCLLTEPES